MHSYRSRLQLANHSVHTRVCMTVRMFDFLFMSYLNSDNEPREALYRHATGAVATHRYGSWLMAM